MSRDTDRLIPEEPLPQFTASDLTDLDPPTPEPETTPLPETDHPLSPKELRQQRRDERNAGRAATHTSTYSPGGDPVKVGEVLSGLIILATSSVAWFLNRRGKRLRMPSVDERESVAQPLARILVRHLPLTEIGPDLVDLTSAATGAHNYLMSEEPLVTPHTPVIIDQGEFE